MTRFICIYSESGSHSVMSNSLQPHEPYSPWNSPGQNTGVGSLFLLQQMSPPRNQTQGSPALQVDSLPAEPSGKPNCVYIYMTINIYIYMYIYTHTHIYTLKDTYIQRYIYIYIYIYIIDKTVTRSTEN